MTISAKQQRWFWVLAFALWAPAVLAEAKIGYVNAARLLEDTPQAEAVSKKLKQEFAAREDELVAEQKKLQRLEERLSRDGPIMSEIERRRLERDLLSRKRDLRRARDDFREDVNIRRNEEIANLLEVVQDAIEAVGREQQFDLIVYEGIAYASPRIDLTELILERLRKSSVKSR